MNFFKTAMAAAMVVVAMGFASCDPEEKIVEVEKGTDELSGTISKDLVLDEFDTYKLVGPLIVENGVKLTIPAGTTIKAKEGFGNYILVLQGGQIFVNGTQEAPVTMTIEDGAAATDRWGGLVVNGDAPLEGNDAKGAAYIGSTEISSAYPYGGTDETDNSGSITYLKLLYTGNSAGSTVEHNGLTLNGVGSGTTIHDIFVKDGSDDGIEFFGGTVNVTNLLVVNSDDDMFDFTRGYKGTLKNAYGIWETGFTSTEGDPGGVEADGNLDGNNDVATAQANFKIENMTIDIRDASAAPMKYIICVRRLATATITNALVKGAGKAGTFIELTDTKGNANVATSISVTNELATNPAVMQNPATGYPEINLAATGNDGCDASLFDWTGYEF